MFQRNVDSEGQSFLSEFRQGSVEAFSGLYQRFQQPIIRYVKTMVRDPEVAEELVQEIFIKVFRFRTQYQEGFAFSTWLWTIARNTVRDYQRGMKLYVAGETGADGQPLCPDSLPSPDQGAEDIIVRKDLRKALVMAIRPLTKLQRRVIWLRIVRQLPYNEISKRLGLSLASVKNLAHRAKSALMMGDFAPGGSYALEPTIS